MNERLKEINDFVDEHFPVSREKNTLNYNKYFDLIGAENYKNMYTINGIKHYSENYNESLYK